MTTEEKAKAYDEALERAMKRVATEPQDDRTTILKDIFPELAESIEDKRINTFLHHTFTAQYLCKDKTGKWHGESVTNILAYLEKQKEISKTADSISTDCMSDAKSESRWHKVEDLLPTTTREVLCCDELGNYFIGRCYGKGNPWLVSMYDEEDKTNEYNPSVSMWMNIPEKTKDDSVEWSEEDDIIKNVISYLNEEYGFKSYNDEWAFRKGLIRQLKSLRSQPKWKPSEEQMMALLSVLRVVKGSGDKIQDNLESLYNDLKKLI